MLEWHQNSPGVWRFIFGSPPYFKGAALSTTTLWFRAGVLKISDHKYRFYATIWNQLKKELSKQKKQIQSQWRDPFNATVTATVWGSGKMAGNLCPYELCICSFPILKLFTQKEDLGSSHSCKKRRRWDTEQAAWQVCGVRSKVLQIV